ncbi:DUF4129 domain-containing protein [bacterium]|nr:DUF4129 domain-containing protein [bacterium]
MKRLAAILMLLLFVYASSCTAQNTIASENKGISNKTETVNPSVISRQIKQILSQPEYNRVYAKDSVPKWWKDFWKKVIDVAGKFFAWFYRSISLHSEQAGRLTSFVFACLVIIAFFALLALIINRISRGIRTNVESGIELDSGDYDILSSRPLISEAQKLADSSDWRGAFRCVYLASISHLDEIGVLRYEKSRTNWEYLGELDKNGKPDIRDQLRPLTSDFDRKFYGRESCDKTDYLNAMAVYERIKCEAAV